MATSPRDSDIISHSNCGTEKHICSSLKAGRLLCNIQSEDSSILQIRGRSDTDTDTGVELRVDTTTPKPVVYVLLFCCTCTAVKPVLERPHRVHGTGEHWNKQWYQCITTPPPPPHLPHTVSAALCSDQSAAAGGFSSTMGHTGTQTGNESSQAFYWLRAALTGSPVRRSHPQWLASAGRLMVSNRPQQKKTSY